MVKVFVLSAFSISGKLIKIGGSFSKLILIWKKISGDRSEMLLTLFKVTVKDRIVGKILLVTAIALSNIRNQ